MKTEDIASIYDDELVFAVMSWMWSKFNSHWSNQNQYNVISSLPKACQNIYSVYTIEEKLIMLGLINVTLIAAKNLPR